MLRQVAIRSSKEAPELAATPSSSENGSSPTPRKPPGNNGPSFDPKLLIRRVEKRLSNLNLAITELAVLAVLSGVGTVIEQEQVCSLMGHYVLFSHKIALEASCSTHIHCQPVDI